MHQPSISKPIILSLALFIGVLTCCGCVEEKMAYIAPDDLPDSWDEASALRNTGIEFLGLEKWTSITYEYRGEEKASLTITTINTLVLTDETELESFIDATIHTTFQTQYEINLTHKGSRTLHQEHVSRYHTYEGYNSSKNTRVLVIGETWNCGIAGVSIICLGVVFQDDNTTTLPQKLVPWVDLVADPAGSIYDTTQQNGLIYDIKCH
ncbi:MAG: hypothetical protein KKG04_07605 [Candidatus Thermoplasmatota archaeon]|nr:hypothetical protein [Candidatus Thermoplasmatota archaeon]